MENEVEILEEDRSIRRMNRQKYFYENLKVISVVALLAFLAMIFGNFFAFILLIAAFTSIAYSIYLNACRLHDIGFSGLWQLPIFIINMTLAFGMNLEAMAQFINFIITIILLSIKGTDGPNKFGQDPLKAAPKYVYESK